MQLGLNDIRCEILHMVRGQNRRAIMCSMVGRVKGQQHAEQGLGGERAELVVYETRHNVGYRGQGLGIFNCAMKITANQRHTEQQ